MTENFGEHTLDSMLLETESPDQFIKTMRENYRRKNHPIPLARWAEKMGYRSPRSLGMLIEGTRLPSTQMIEALAKDYGLSRLEKRYLELLTLYKRGDTSPALKDEVYSEIQSIRTKKENAKYELNFEEMSWMSSWYIFVIRQLVGTKGFIEDPSWIRKRLRNKVELKDIQSAIHQLIKVGGLTRDKLTGKLKKAPFSFVNLKDAPNSSIRSHHKQMIQRAIESIDQTGTYEREFNSLVFAMDRKHLPELKQKIREFCTKINDMDSRSEEPDGVFQFNVQLFEHTIDSPSGTACADKLQ